MARTSQASPPGLSGTDLTGTDLTGRRFTAPRLPGIPRARGSTDATLGRRPGSLRHSHSHALARTASTASTAATASPASAASTASHAAPRLRR